MLTEVLSRTLWMIEGWPHKCFGVLDATFEVAICQRFKTDKTCFEWLKSLEGKSATEKIILERSAFQTRPVKHIDLALAVGLGTVRL